MIDSIPTLNAARPDRPVTATEASKGLLVLNPAAGAGQPEELRQRVRAALALIACDVYEATGREKLDEVVRRAVGDYDYAWVAAVGGDGTVSAVANGLLDSGIPLAIIPAGTDNTLAQELAIPQTIEASCQLLLGSSDLHRIDGIEIDQRLYFQQVGVGPESEVKQTTSSAQKNRRGILVRLANAVRQAFGWQLSQFTLIVDGRSYELEASELIIANAGKAGVVDLTWHDDIRPDDGRIDDGRIDIAAIGAQSIADYFRLGWALLRRRPPGRNHIRFFAARDRLHLAMKKPLPIHGDGQSLAARDELAATLVPGLLTVMVPAAAQEEGSSGMQPASEADPAPAAGDASLLATLRYLLTRTFHEWREDKASRLAAALAYYTVFSLPSLLVLSLAVAGLFYDQQAAQDEIMAQAENLLGEAGAEVLTEILENASNPALGSIASVVSLALLFFGASGVFTQLQDAMNTIWEVKPKPGRGILGTLKDRILSFTMVLSVGFLLLVSLILSTVLAALSDFVTGLAPDALWLAQFVNFVFSLGGIALLFALIFKTIPDVKIGWRDVWLGAVVTALLFNVGKWAIGLYLARSAPASAYGAAGSLIVVLLWVYYSAQIVFLGAEFTQVYARRFGREIVADEGAVHLAEIDRVQQGLPDRAQPARPQRIKDGA